MYLDKEKADYKKNTTRPIHSLTKKFKKEANFFIVTTKKETRAAKWAHETRRGAAAGEEWRV